MKTAPEKPYVPAGTKKNPNSLTYLFRLIRTEYAKMGEQRFAALLESIELSFPEKPVDRTTVRRIENNKGDIHYFHIEKLAAFTQIPAGALLLFSRMFANRRDKFSKEHNNALADKLVAILERVSDDTIFDATELRLWSEILRNDQGQK